MPASLQALLKHVIDYAGTFPPACLSLDESIRNYARYRNGPDSWLLGRFVCPAVRLAELKPYAELFKEGDPFHFAVLGSRGQNAEEAARNLAFDLHQLDAFRVYHGGRVVPDVLELYLPESVLPDGLRPDGVKAPQITFYEAPEAATEAVVSALQAINQSRAADAGLAGFKLRCGGGDPRAVPSTEQVAFVIATCRAADVPLKFTAGLHHPFRHYDANLRTMVHGFINVFGAGVLAHARGLSEGRIRLILEDEDVGHFAFDDQALRWKEYSASVAEIAAVRRDAVISFGSCSFDEPCDDLRALGWLGGTP